MCKKRFLFHKGDTLKYSFDSLHVSILVLGPVNSELQLAACPERTQNSELQLTACPDKLIILGDFNAMVGADWPAWEIILGRHGVGHCNSNGQLLLETCMAYNLHITNSNFQLPLRNHTSWMHPRSNTGI